MVLNKIKVFQSIQADCALLGIHADELSRKRDLNAKSWITFSSYILGTLLSGYYFIYVEKTFEQYIKSYNVTTSFLVCILQFINLFLQMPKLTDFFLTISDFVQQRQNCLESGDIYNKAIRLAEQIYRIIYFVFTKVAVANAVLSLYIKCVYVYYFTATPTDDAFQLPLLMWFPFNCQTPVGYTVACALELAMCWAQLMISSCLASAGCVAFLIGLAVTEDLTNTLCVIQKNIKTKRNRPKGLIKLYQFIESHSTVKETIGNFMDVFQWVSAILLLWCIGTLCVALVLLEMGLKGNNSVWIAVSILQMSIGLAFLLCELGQRITNAFDDIDEVPLIELNWYLLPMKIRKMLPTILINSQGAVALHCFGSILCGRETFKDVNSRAFSYFMVLRGFS